MNNKKQKPCHLRDRIFALELLTRFELVEVCRPPTASRRSAETAFLLMRLRREVTGSNG